MVDVTVLRDEGVVLRTHPLGEADRIVTLLTRRHGRIRAVAKGVRRTGSRFGARLEPGSVVDAQLWVGRSLDVVREVVSVAAYGPRIAADWASHSCAQVVMETAERLTSEEREPALRLYGLTVGALAALAGGTHAAPRILDAYLLRSLAVSGWEAALTDCARCGLPGPHRWWSPLGGGTTCADCRPAGSANASTAALELMVALRDADWARADRAEERVAREVSGLVAAYTQVQLERRLRSLAQVERV
jgi:DNA repair protein RecO (recombination protein O)